MSLIYLMSARWSVGCVRGEMVLVLVPVAEEVELGGGGLEVVLVLVGGEVV